MGMPQFILFFIFWISDTTACGATQSTQSYISSHIWSLGIRRKRSCRRQVLAAEAAEEGLHALLPVAWSQKAVQESSVTKAHANIRRRSANASNLETGEILTVRATCTCACALLARCRTHRMRKRWVGTRHFQIITGSTHSRPRHLISQR